jgi:hypothetical protein
MKLAKLVDPQFQTALKKLAAEELPLRTAFSLRGIIKQANDELAKYDEVRAEALKRFGDKKEDGSLDIDEKGTVKLSEDNMKQFVEQLNQLLITEVSFATVKVADLGTKVNLSANDLIILDTLISE